jgi:predicted O-methyltransferase YrrM
MLSKLKILTRPIRSHSRNLFVFRVIRRARIVSVYVKPQWTNSLKWVFQKTEESNFNYSITDLNKMYLANFVSTVTGCEVKSAREFISEIELDFDLKTHFQRKVIESEKSNKYEIDYARRVGWYAFVRATKPKLVVETGVDEGVGSCVIAAALIQNSREGFPGKYVGTEINPNAGHFFSGVYAKVGEIRYGDSIDQLSKIEDEIDIFINDSDHDVDYEYNEYKIIQGKLSPRAILLGDNAHVSSSLMRFSNERGRCFLFFDEKPEKHWYPGAGIGISYLK